MTPKEIQLSKKFRIQTIKAIAAILFFLVTYVIILSLALALTALCFYGAYKIVIIWTNLFIIVLAIGIASLGAMVLAFLTKFIFKSHVSDLTGYIEVTKEEEPKLFKLIDDIVEIVETDFPNKVYLSADVNASVFYDSSFWSMFIPNKKNLVVGLGLVNSLYEDEVKAVLAHEFGHFSQKTMKVGSYVYNVNQVIFNLINDNDDFDRMVYNWSKINDFFPFFVEIARSIVKGIQSILRSLFILVNKSYMGLSREMEFHADETAALVTGIEPLKTSLLRMSLMDQSFDAALSFYNERISENIKSPNIYKEQQFILNFWADEYEIPIVNGLPLVSQDQWKRFNKSKLEIENQWASHPSSEDRIKRLEQIKMIFPIVNSGLANQIFTNIESFQKKFSEMIFTNVTYKGEATDLPIDAFKHEFTKVHLENKHADFYNNYYDNKNPIPFDLDAKQEPVGNLLVEELFSDEKVDWVYESIALMNDYDTVTQIGEGNIPVKTFDYDGKRHTKKYARIFKFKLEKDLNKLTTKIAHNDQLIYYFFSSLAEKMGTKIVLKNLYSNFFDLDKNYDEMYRPFIEIQNEIQFVNYNVTLEQITNNFRKISTLEAVFKPIIVKMLEDKVFQPFLTNDTKELLELYTSRSFKYFDNNDYNNDNLQLLFKVLEHYPVLLNKGYFNLKQKVLTYQEDLLKSQEKAIVKDNNNHYQ